ncbi:MAG: exodeoxyribonuclease V subunit alpha [Myxococcales bacterium]|nr:exodeoxyribonuclease V subunit alpha [Myxococcales bacterium]
MKIECTMTSAWSQYQALDEGQGQRPGRLRLLTSQLRKDRSATHHVSLAELLMSAVSRDDEGNRCALLLVLVAALENQESGSTRLPITVDGQICIRTRLKTRLRDVMSGDLTWFDGALDALMTEFENDTLRPLIGPEAARCPFIVRDGWLHENRAFHQELSLAQRTAQMAAQLTAASALDQNVLSLEFPLSDEQLHAVEKTLVRQLTLVTGGPGTGKTSIVVALIKALVSEGVAMGNIVLAAPTGKAAFRMDQAIRDGLSQGRNTLDGLAPAMTLHRLLGYHPRGGRFKHHPRNLLTTSAVIVDEASMIDTHLMFRLVRALPESSKLILLGDNDQLPSVGSGQVYKDLINALPEATARLTKSFRMRDDDPNGRDILNFAAAIRDGQPTLASIGQKTSVEAIRWAGAEHVSDSVTKDAISVAWYERQFSFLATIPFITTISSGEVLDETMNAAYSELLDAFERTQVLAVTREGPAGVNALNRQFQTLHCERHHLNPKRPFQTGTPVIMRRNDYQNGLFNGDQGVVIGPQNGDPSELCVLFRGANGTRLFPLGSLMGDLELAYAVTVHQSQGSEYESVLICLPTVDVPILTRELLYTGVTRSRHSVITWGHVQSLQWACQRAALRHSTLEALLNSAVSASTPSFDDRTK